MINKKNNIFISFILLVFLMISCNPENKFDNLDEVKIYYEKAYDYYWAKTRWRKKEFSDYFKSYKKAIKKFAIVRYVTAPNRKFENEDLYNDAADKEIECYKKRDDHKGAVKVAKTWVEEYPNRNSYLNLGQLLSRYVSKSRTIELYNEGIRKGINLYSLLAEIYTKSGDYDLAIENYEKAIENGDNLYTKLAKIYEIKNDYYNAKRTLLNAVESKPESAEEYYQKLLKLAEHNNNKYDEDYFIDKLIYLNPRKEDYRAMKINNYIDEERYYRAELEIESAAIWVNSFDKDDYLKRMYRKIILSKWDDDDFKLYANRNVNELGKFLFGHYMKIKNSSEFKLKNINIQINYKNLFNVFSYKVYSLYSYDYKEIQYNQFTKENGERFNTDKWEIKNIKIVYDVTFKGASVTKTVRYSF